MRGVRAATGGSPASALERGRVEVATVVRLLTAVLLLGLALLVVALGQGVAHARDLGGPGGDTTEESTSPALPRAGAGGVSAVQPAPLASPSVNGGARDADLRAAVNAAESWLTQTGGPAPAAAAGTPRADPGTPGSSQAPGSVLGPESWGRGWRPRSAEPVEPALVAQRAGDGGTDDATRPPTTPASSPVKETMSTAQRLAGNVRSNLTSHYSDLTRNVSMDYVRNLNRQIERGAEFASRLAPDARVADAPRDVRSAIQRVGVQLQSLGRIGQDEGAERVRMATRISAYAEAAAAAADLAQARAAVARDATPPAVMPENAPVGEEHSVHTVVADLPEPATAVAWSQDMISNVGDAGSRTDHRLRMNDLEAAINNSAAAAESYAAQNDPVRARDAMNTAIQQLRQLSQVGAEISMAVGKKAEETSAVGAAASTYGEALWKAALPSRGTPPGEKPGKGSELQHGTPDRDAPVLDAGVGTPDPAVPVAEAGGGGLPVVATSSPTPTPAPAAPVSAAADVAPTGTDSINRGNDFSLVGNEAMLADLPSDTVFDNSAVMSAG